MSMFSAILILIILFYGVYGFKRGVIKTGVSLVGTIAVLVISYVFKDYLANFLMKHLPFFNFGGIFNGISSINILMYEMISFIFIFVILYCILNILLSLSGLIEKILKMTIILAIPSKILGAILGLIEGIIVAYLVSFVFIHIPLTEEYVMNSKTSIVLLERTPIIGEMALKTTLALEEINRDLSNVKTEEEIDEANLKVLHTLIYYKLIDQNDAQKLIDSKKIVFKNSVEVGG